MSNTEPTGISADGERTVRHCELIVTFLGSGSSGNSSVVSGTHGALLLDCGFSAKETLRRMVAAGIDPGSVDAILVTHEHGDHVRGMRVLAKRLEVPVYVTAGTADACPRASLASDIRMIEAGREFEAAGMRVTAFRTSHDAAEPVGYRIENECGASLGIATDTGVLTPEATEALESCDIVGIECNHDREMLLHGPYPWFLKRRIESDRGHLSNEDAALALGNLTSGRVREVVALHVSRTNNTPGLATTALVQVANEKGVRVRTIPHD